LFYSYDVEVIHIMKYFFTFISVCNFYKVLDRKEGEAKVVLEEIVRKQNMHGEITLVIEFHIRVLALILSNSENE